MGFNLGGFMRLFVLVSGLLALGIISAAAQDTAPAAEPAKPDETVTVDANKITCVVSDPPTGSRLGAHRTCHTQAEWDRLRADSAMTMQDLTNREMNRERTIHTGN